MNKENRLIPTVCKELRLRGYSLATERTYIQWIKRFLQFHRYRHPKEMKEDDITQFLSHLAINLKVAASTQNQALNALVFLFREVLKMDFGDFNSFVRAKRPKLMPVVLSRNEVTLILSQLSGTPLIMASLLYGCGLRLKECLRLRVQDIDFERKQLWVRQGKGKKDRVIPLPVVIKRSLKDHLCLVRKRHEIDLKEGYGNVYLPNALERKYPKAAFEWSWQYVFPSYKRSKDPRSGIIRRHHVHENGLIRHIKKAAQKCDINKKLTTHSFRHSYATHLLEKGEDINIIQKLLGHKDIKTTMMYLHVMDKGVNNTKSPLDEIFSQELCDNNAGKEKGLVEDKSSYRNEANMQVDKEEEVVDKSSWSLMSWLGFRARNVLYRMSEIFTCNR